MIEGDGANISSALNETENLGVMQVKCNIAIPDYPSRRGLAVDPQPTLGRGGGRHSAFRIPIG